MSNPFEVLGIDKDADEETIKKAYKKLCFDSHPDRFQDEKEKVEAEKKFKEIQVAYNEIKDGGTPTPEGFQNPFSDFINFFRREVYTPSSIQIQSPIVLSFKESIQGCTKTLDYKLTGDCVSCNGGGHIATSTKCKTCDGKGVKKTKLGGKSWFGILGIVEEPCKDCQGSGKLLEECKRCSGEGVSDIIINGNVTFQPNTPPRGKVKIVRDFDGKKVDVFINVVVEEPTKFMFTQQGLEYNTSIGVSDFLLGGKLTVDVCDGDNPVEVVYSTCQQEVVVKGRGFGLGNNRCDLKVIISPEFPKVLTEAQVQAANKLKEVGL